MPAHIATFWRKSRRGNALLLLLSTCATSGPQDQAVLPFPPLAEPVALPAPMGLSPPVPVVVYPKGQVHLPQADGHELSDAPKPAPYSRPEPQQAPTPEEAASNRVPPPPLTTQRRPDCEPLPTPHRGGDALHNRCADRVPLNHFPGFDVLIRGKHFDALQLGRRVLWEVKTDRFDTYSRFLQEQVVDNQLSELRRERDLARECGYGFSVGVRNAAHKAALEKLERTIDIVVMDWC